MTERTHLLPTNATAFLRSYSEALDRTPVLEEAIEGMRGVKYRRPLIGSYAAWVLMQYGLGPISMFFETPEAAVDAGIPWQRRRGTVAAIEDALGWLGYDATSIEHQKPTRRRWNLYQIGMGQTPEAELPILLQAEYLAGLSDPARSRFFRGWHGYDVRAMEWSGHRWGHALWSDDSGVRLDGGTVKWSHGEASSGSLIGGEEARQALGIDVEAGGEPGWWDAPWEAPGVTWEGIVDVAAFKAWLLFRLPVHVGFFGADGDPIGYRRPIAVRNVTDDVEPGGDAIAIEVECRTNFGDGEGREVASCALVFRGGNVDLTRPGKLWLEPHEFTFEDGVDPYAVTVGFAPLDFTFRRTVRQHVTLTLEI